MFRIRRNRLSTHLVVAAYLAATTLGGLWHDHTEHAGADHAGPDEHAAAGGCEHDAADHGASHAHCASESACAVSHGQTSHDDDCVLCRFVGQRVITAEIGQLDQVSDLSVALAVAHPQRTVVSIASTTHSRAPPRAV